MEIVEDSSKKKHKKKHKRKHSDEEVSSEKSDISENVDQEFETRKKKKQKKHNSDEDATSSTDSSSHDQDTREDVSKKKHKKKKKKYHSDEEIPKEEMQSEVPEKKRKKKKSKYKEDSSSSDDSQDKNLEKKIEKPRSPPNPELADPSKFGQWGNASFNDDSKRQEKFLRLMGGLKKGKPDEASSQTVNKKGLFCSSSEKKKGLFGSLQPSGSTRDNYAMNTTRGETLNKQLEDQFEQARNFRFNKKKGTGLGFEEPPDESTGPPAESKSFHIDKDASKSVKFDD